MARLVFEAIVDTHEEPQMWQIRLNEFFLDTVGPEAMKITEGNRGYVYDCFMRGNGENNNSLYTPKEEYYDKKIKKTISAYCVDEDEKMSFLNFVREAGERVRAMEKKNPTGRSGGESDDLPKDRIRTSIRGVGRSPENESKDDKIKRKFKELGL